MTITIDDSNPQAKKFVAYVRTLPLASVKTTGSKTKSVRETALAEGAVTVEEFFDGVRRRIDEQYDKLENA